jgi:hypothetical protein
MPSTAESSSAAHNGVLVGGEYQGEREGADGGEGGRVLDAAGVRWQRRGGVRGRRGRGGEEEMAACLGMKNEGCSYLPHWRGSTAP